MNRGGKTLKRETFTQSRLMEFFSEKELSLQIGYGKRMWPAALTKELVDNALDACESEDQTPEITVTIGDDVLTVEDSGPGMPEETLKDSLDYSIRVSDKNFYVSPTRGQLGNALKCVWAAPFVADGERGVVEVVTGNKHHTIEATLDHIAQVPRLEHRDVKNGDVKNGTFVKIHYPDLGGLKAADSPGYLQSVSARDVMVGFSLFNPHARFRLDGECLEPTDANWKKWVPTDRTSADWYTLEQMRDLIAANVARERNGAPEKTVREFISEFDGLAGSAKQKLVTDACGLKGDYLHDLVSGREIDLQSVRLLLDSMQEHSRTVRPQRLGVIGDEHLIRVMADHCCVDGESVRYKKVYGKDERRPFVLEAAFGVLTKECEGGHGERFVGLNWSPALQNPIEELGQLLGERRVDGWDPVVVAVHIATPQFDYTDRGKSRLDIPEDLGAALQTAVKSITKDWVKAKKKADRKEQVQAREIEEMRRRRKRHEWTIKDAAYSVMEEAYMMASGDGQLPANARQIMYAARPGVLELTGGKELDDQYFTQTLLPNFIDGHPDLTESWDVVYDARGRIREPHTGKTVDLGTLEVRQYIKAWRDRVASKCDVVMEAEGLRSISTTGPVLRFKNVLFVEKEGFYPILEHAKIAERFDIAIMSTKGVSVTAARSLVESLSEVGVTIYVVRDFDKSGFTIAETLKSDTRRYQFDHRVDVVDLGLRLEDVEGMGLESEPVSYPGKKDPRENLRDNSATDEECGFLVTERTYGGGWAGQRVELNAMTSPQFLAWLEGKLEEYGVGKVVPDQESLAAVYRRNWRVSKAVEILEEAREVWDAGDDAIEPPGDLQERVEGILEQSKRMRWEKAVEQVARGEGGGA